MFGVAASVPARLLAFGDQGLQGLANVLVALLIAQSMTVDEFASAGLAVGLYYFFFSFHRSSVVLPFILDHSVEGAAADKVALWWTASTLFGIASTLAAALLLAAAYTLAAPDWVLDAFLYLVAMILPMTAAEFGRRAAYQVGRPDRAVAISLVYLSTGLAVAGLAPGGSTHLGGFAYAAAGVGGSLVYLLRDRPQLRSVRAALAEFAPYRSFALWQSSASLFSVLYTTSVVVLVATFAGAVAAAVYTAARTLVNPALSIVSAVDSFDKPRAGRALAGGGIPALKSSVQRTRLLVATLTGGYLIVLVAVTPWLLRIFFGEAYVDNVVETRVLALAFFLICLNQPSETYLVILKAARHLFVVRCVTAFLATGAIYFAAERFGIAGAMWAIVVVQIVALVGLALAERDATRRFLKAGVTADAR